MATQTEEREQHEITWEEPPSPRRGPQGGESRSKFYGLLEQVMAKPGEWARVAEYEKHRSAYATAAYLKSDKVRKPEGSFDIRARKIQVAETGDEDKDFVGRVYVRFNEPEPKKAAKKTPAKK